MAACCSCGARSAATRSCTPSSSGYARRLLPHDPAWEKDFLAERERIADHLGDASARIEDVGSTSLGARDAVRQPAARGVAAGVIR